MKKSKNNALINPNENFNPAYSSYPQSEDIYNKNTETNLNPENLSKPKHTRSDNESWNEKNFNEDHSGDDLDVPGSELDDQQEKIGSEDEENNYYSTGGDAHNNLDENNGY